MMKNRVKRQGGVCVLLLPGIVLICFAALLLGGCGKVRSPKLLARQAKSTYGSCTVVSTTQTDKMTKVVLRDKLQDFEYSIWSQMSEIWVDGTSFGSLPGTYDDFKTSLQQKVLQDLAAEIDQVCKDAGVDYEAGDGTCNILIIRTDDATAAEKAACKCAELIQAENKKNRLDGLEIPVYGKDAEKWYHSNYHYGSVLLPSTSWRTVADEQADYYTEMAQLQTDPKAVYVRSRAGTFRDTGADLDRVVHVLGSSYPEKADDPVMFYYFQSSKGKEYYLCDFNYYEKDSSRYAWYTNYTP